MNKDPEFPDYTPAPSSDARPSYRYRLIDSGALPAVTIVTPYYNTGEVFRETAVSILRQTMQQWEWIIVNDASTDPDALEVLDEYRESDPRIRIVDHDQNRGLSAARNTGFAEARTEYVIQLDSDDLLEPTMVEKLYWFLQSYPAYSFAKGYTVGFGAEAYVWVNGFHAGDEFMETNLADATAMIRRSVHQEVAGYDESNRGGLEDWDFWLKCAAHGYWGGTVHEPLSWYRRRLHHGDRWDNWDGGVQEEEFRSKLKARYPGLWRGEFPQLEIQRELAYESIPDAVPVANELAKDRPRILMLIPWMTVGGADKFNVDAVEQLTNRGWEVTIATTMDGDHSWARQFARFTSDIFPLHRFLRPVDFPRFLRYLIGSRAPDIVMVSNSELGYQLLPYLRAHHPGPTYVDLSHMEQPDWKSGGHPNLSNIYRSEVDLSIVISEHLRSWMIERNGDGSRIAVCHLGADGDQWRPDPVERRRVRDEFEIDDDTTVILYAGRLTEQKQPKVFAETILNLSRMQEGFVAIVAGDGEDRGWLDAYIQENDLDPHIAMLGAVSSDRVLDLLHAADVFFLPSQWEGIALSIYEAMACAVPVVGADVGGQAELVTSDTGILLERDTPRREAYAYARALRELIADPERRAQMGRAGRERLIEGFSLDTMGSRLVELLDQAVELHKTDPRSVVPVDAARASATLAVEYQRAFLLLEAAWRREMTPLTIPAPSGWRWAAYRAVSVPLGPAYRRLAAGDSAWAIRARNRTRSALDIAPSDVPWSSGIDPAETASRRTVGQITYGLLMNVFGAPYRWLKRRNPDQMAAWRDRIRAGFGYHR